MHTTFSFCYTSTRFLEIIDRKCCIVWGGYSDLVPTGVCRWSFKGHFGGKGYPLLGFFIQENDVFVYFSDEMGENI